LLRQGRHTELRATGFGLHTLSTSELWSLLATRARAEGKEKEKSTHELRRGRALSEDQFREWVNRRSRLPLAVRGHTFVLKGDNIIVVDGGQFVYEEALQLVRVLNSRNPFAQINASLMISERNGTLRLIVLVLIAVILVFVLLLARH